MIRWENSQPWLEKWLGLIGWFWCVPALSGLRVPSTWDYRFVPLWSVLQVFIAVIIFFFYYLSFSPVYCVCECMCTCACTCCNVHVDGRVQHPGASSLTPSWESWDWLVLPGLEAVTFACLSVSPSAFSIVGLGTEPRVLCMLGKSTKLYPSS